jgi:hypothetical protein
MRHPKVRSAEVSLLEVTPTLAEVYPTEICVAKVSPSEVYPLQINIAKVNTSKVSTMQTRFVEVRH